MKTINKTKKITKNAIVKKMKPYNNKYKKQPSANEKWTQVLCEILMMKHIHLKSNSNFDENVFIRGLLHNVISIAKRHNHIEHTRITSLG